MWAKFARYMSLCCRITRRHGRLVERDFLGGIALLAHIPHDQPLADPC
jgi:hypothetical protein